MWSRKHQKSRVSQRKSTVLQGPGRPGVLPPAVQRGVLPPADPVLPALRQPRVQGDQGLLQQPAPVSCPRRDGAPAPGTHPQAGALCALPSHSGAENLTLASFFLCFLCLRRVVGSREIRAFILSGVRRSDLAVCTEKRTQLFYS